MVLDRWQENVGDTVYTADVELEGSHRLRVEYFERVGGCVGRGLLAATIRNPNLNRNGNYCGRHVDTNHYQHAGRCHGDRNGDGDRDTNGASGHRNADNRTARADGNGDRHNRTARTNRNGDGNGDTNNSGRNAHRNTDGDADPVGGSSIQ